MTDEAFSASLTAGEGKEAEAEGEIGLLFELVSSFIPSFAGTTGKLLGEDDALLSGSATGSGEFPKTGEKERENNK